jgi:hypothetical protein
VSGGALELVKKTKRAATSTAKAAESKGRDILASVPASVPSPSRVTNQIELATSHLYRRARSASTSLHLHEVTSRVPIIRQAISNVVSVDGIVSLAELALLLNKLIPRTYPVCTFSGASADLAVTSSQVLAQDSSTSCPWRARLPPQSFQHPLHRRLLDPVPLLGICHSVAPTLIFLCLQFGSYSPHGPRHSSFITHARTTL